MEINLRKANAVQAEIRKAISAVKAETTLNLTEFTKDVQTELIKASQAYGDAVDRKIALTSALYNIRNSVATANATAGINTLLGDIEKGDKVMEIYTNMSVQPVMKTVDEVNARIEKLKASPADARTAIYGDRYSNVETSVVYQEAILDAKIKVKDLKRERQTMQDKLLSLNVNTLITIKPEDEALLKEEGII